MAYTQLWLYFHKGQSCISGESGCRRKQAEKHSNFRSITTHKGVAVLMVFLGQNVRLRPVRKADLEAIVSWSNDSEVDRYMDGGLPKDMDECDEWYEASRRDRHVRRFAIETLEGELIGDISLSQIAWRSGDAELVVRIGKKEYWGRGFGSDAVYSALDIAFGRLGLNRVYLRVYSFNKRAIRCYQKCGFKYEGVLKRTARDGDDWKEIVLMCKLKSEHEPMNLQDAQSAV